MNPSPEAIEAINAYAASLNGGWAGNDDAAVVAAANAPAIDNPTPQPNVQKPYTYVTLLGGLSSMAIARLVALPALPRIIDDINAGDLVACQRWIATLVAGGVITLQEAGAIGAIMADTQPDPDWPAQISWAEANLGRKIDHDDAAKARPN